MSAARTALGAAMSLAALLNSLLDAFAQLKPPHVPGLRGAPFAVASIRRRTSRASARAPRGTRNRRRVSSRSRAISSRARISIRTATQWLNPRYWRCNSPRQIADMRSGGAGAGTSDPRIGANPPVSARWGDCTKDWPRDNIVSPYPFATAAEHYAALQSRRAKARRPDEAHLRDDAEVGRRLRRVSARRAARLELRPRDAGADVPVDSHARVSAAHGAAAVPRGRRRRAPMVGVVLLARRASCGNGRRDRSRSASS